MTVARLAPDLLTGFHQSEAILLAVNLTGVLFALLLRHQLIKRGNGRGGIVGEKEQAALGELGLYLRIEERYFN